jgi:hypothetical protein
MALRYAILYVVLCSCDASRGLDSRPLPPHGAGVGVVMVENDSQLVIGYASFTSDATANRDREVQRAPWDMSGQSLTEDASVTIGDCVASRYVEKVPVRDEISAGDVVVDTAGASFRLSFDDLIGVYDSYHEARAAAWAPGAPIRVSTGGDAVETFAEALVAPTPLPTVSVVGADGRHFSRAGTVSLSWPAQATGDDVIVELDDQSHGAPFHALRCVYPVAAGAATVPSEALTTLEQGSGTLTVWTARRRDLDAGDYQVALVARAQARDGGASSIYIE